MKHLLIVLVFAVSPAAAYAQADVVRVQIDSGRPAPVDGPPLTKRGPGQRESSTSCQRVWLPPTKEPRSGGIARSFRYRRRL